MASQKRAKRKRDNSPRWRALWAALFISALIAAVIGSPFAEPVRVRVSGSRAHDQQRITQILRRYSSTPSLLLNSSALEAEVERAPDVMAASFKSNVFGRARLNLQYRVPVALLKPGTAIDATGLPFPLGSRKAPNLQISNKVDDFRTILTISDASLLNRLARVAEKIQVSLPKLAGTLEIDDRERISLRSEGLVVEFGDTSSLDEKVTILAKALAEDPQWPERGGRIVVVDPENPVQVR